MLQANKTFLAMNELHHHLLIIMRSNGSGYNIRRRFLREFPGSSPQASLLPFASYSYVHMSITFCTYILLHNCR